MQVHIPGHQRGMRPDVWIVETVYGVCSIVGINPNGPRWGKYISYWYDPTMMPHAGGWQMTRERAEKELAKMRHLEEVSLLGEPDFY